MTPHTFSLHINTVEVPVGDLRRAIEWYGAALGLRCTWSNEQHALLSSAGDSGESASGVRLLLVQTDDETRLGFSNSSNGLRHSVIDFRTTDLEGLHAHLRGQEAIVDDLQPPVNAWAPRGFGFEDSEGNRLAAFTYVS
jgi:catechol 2,3-dioxygenase-like lactoylglutathione lyase family enzyme